MIAAEDLLSLHMSAGVVPVSSDELEVHLDPTHWDKLLIQLHAGHLQRIAQSR